MVIKEFTSNEKKWIKEAKQLFKKMPKNIRLYSYCGELTICKVGQPSYEVSDGITSASINCCNVIEDVHDGMNYGRC